MKLLAETRYTIEMPNSLVFDETEPEFDESWFTKCDWTDNVNQFSKQSSKYIVSIHRNTSNNQVILDYHWTTKQPELDLPEGFLSVLPDFFLNDLSVEEQYLGIELKGFTEYNRHGKIFRAHPDYRNEGPWNDFAMIEPGAKIRTALPLRTWIRMVITIKRPWTMQ